MANTFVQLNDTPSDYQFGANKFVRVNSSGNALQFWDINLSDLADTRLTGGYEPTVGQTLQYAADGKWRPASGDIYDVGNGISKDGLRLDVVAAANGGLTSDLTGVYLTDIANISGTYGNASHVPVLTVNSKGQVTAVTPTQIVAQAATTITNDFVGNVLGTSGQIRVTGGTGNNSNATIDLVATGVTAAVYGNVTHLPQITVDTYGRIQNVDMIQIAASGNSSSSGNVLNFQKIEIAGQTVISADRVNDTLTFTAGTGSTITTNANADTINFGVDAGAIAGQIDLNDLNNINAGSPSDGQALVWDSANSEWTAGSATFTLADSGVTAGTYGNGSVSPRITVDAQGRVTSVTEVAIPQGDITGVTAGTGLDGGGTSGTVTLNLEQTGVTPGTYGNALVYPVITVDALGRVTNVSVENDSGAASGIYQTLSWNSSTNQLTISNGNTVDLSVLDVPAQTLSLSGNTLSISAGNSVDLSSFAGGGSGGIADLSSNTISDLGDVSSSAPTAGQALVWNSESSQWVPGTVASAYGNAEVQAYLDAQSYSNVDSDAQTLSLSGNTITISGSGSSVTGIATETYVATQINALTDGAPEALDTLAEIANALNSSNSTLSTVAFSGLYNDLGSRPTLALSGNTYLTYDGANIDLRGVVGQTGATGPQGPQGNIGLTGPQGPQGNVGPQGDGNAGISTATVNGSGNLIITLNDSTTIDAGNIKGTDGATGATGAQGNAGINGSDGVGIISTTIVGSNLVVNYSNTSTQDVGNIQGPQGAEGVHVTNASLSTNDLIITLSNATTINAGNVRGPIGPQGATGPQGSQGNTGNDGTNISSATVNGSGNLILTLSDASTIDAGNVKGQDGAVDQTLSLAGNVITISGSGSSVDLTSALGNVSGGGGTPGGADHQVQFNDNGSFAGDSDFTFDGSILNVGYSGGSGTIRTFGIYSPQSVSSFGIGTHNGTTQLTNQSLSASGSSTATTIHGGLFFAADANGNKYVNFNGTDIYNLPLANITNVSSTAPTNGQALVWNSSTSEWEPGTVSGGGGSYSNSDVDAYLSGGTGIDYSTGEISLANTAVTAGTYGSATKSARITVDQQGRVTSVTEATIAGGGGGGGGSGASVQRFKVNYTLSGAIASISNTTSGINSITVSNATSGDISITLDSAYNFPPASVMFYGHNYTNNVYNMVPMTTSKTLTAGGTSNAPTAFNGSSTITFQLTVSESVTAASKSGVGVFPAVPAHAWVEFVVYD